MFFADLFLQVDVFGLEAVLQLFDLRECRSQVFFCFESLQFRTGSCGEYFEDRHFLWISDHRLVIKNGQVPDHGPGRIGEWNSEKALRLKAYEIDITRE